MEINSEWKTAKRGFFVNFCAQQLIFLFWEDCGQLGYLDIAASSQFLLQTG